MHRAERPASDRGSNIDHLDRAVFERDDRALRSEGRAGRQRVYCLEPRRHRISLKGGGYDPSAPVLDEAVGHVGLTDCLALEELEGIEVFDLYGLRRLHAEAVRQDQRLIDRLITKSGLDLVKMKIRIPDPKAMDIPRIMSTIFVLILKR
jgi:hypothetical protein